MEPLRGDGVSGLTVAVVRVAVEIIPNDGDFGSWLMPADEQTEEERSFKILSSSTKDQSRQIS